MRVRFPPGTCSKPDSGLPFGQELSPVGSVLLSGFERVPRAPFPLMARKVLMCFALTMNNVGHDPLGEAAARRVGSTKARRGRPRKNTAQKHVVQKPAAAEIVAEETAVEETIVDERVVRARGLLAATLRVWELKHRISE